MDTGISECEEGFETGALGLGWLSERESAETGAAAVPEGMFHGKHLFPYSGGRL